MEIIPLMLIAVIILLSSFPAPIKVAGRGGGGGGGGAGGLVGSGAGSGYMGGGSSNGFLGGPGGGSVGDVGTGHKGGVAYTKPPPGGGDTGTVVVVTPKKPKEHEPATKVLPMPPECKVEVKDCISAHILGGAGPPTYRGPCCLKLNKSVACVCKYLRSHDPKLSKGANDVLRGCNFNRTKCSTMPMPQVCRHEAKHCIYSHIYGGLGAPQHRGACCEKFKFSKKCVCTFVKSKDPHLSRHAKGVIESCRFTNANCPN